MQPIDPDLAAKLASAFKGTGGVSELYEVIWENFAMLDQVRQSSPGKPNWKRITDELNAAGIRVRGRRIKSETVRRTYARVKKWYADHPRALSALQQTLPLSLPQPVAPSPPPPSSARGNFRDRLNAAILPVTKKDTENG